MWACIMWWPEVAVETQCCTCQNVKHSNLTHSVRPSPWKEKIARLFDRVRQAPSLSQPDYPMGSHMLLIQSPHFIVPTCFNRDTHSIASATFFFSKCSIHWTSLILHQPLVGTSISGSPSMSPVILLDLTGNLQGYLLVQVAHMCPPTYGPQGFGQQPPPTYGSFCYSNGQI